MKMTGKKEWRWGVEKQEAFRKLKRLLITALVLAVLDNNHKFWMEIDALEYTVRKVLSQQQSNNSQQLVAYISQALNETKKNYEIYD